jgi:hypothetical protein
MSRDEVMTSGHHDGHHARIDEDVRHLGNLSGLRR